MNRRGFVGRTALATAGAGLAAWKPGAAAAAPGSPPGWEDGPVGPVGPQLDPSDRSPNRDPLEVQRATLVVNGLDPSNLWAGYLDMLQEGGVDCWHRGGGDVQAFSEAYDFLDRHSDRITPVRTVAEVRQAKRDGRIAHIFGWQSAENLQTTSPPPPDPTGLRAYYEMGLRIVGIAYNVANQFGAGCIEPHVPLTKAGERLVAEIHRMGIVLDVGGHTGDQTSFDALEISRGVPVICSHTNIRALVDNPRNMGDRLIEAIAETGGVIGITAFNDFHARTRRDADVVRTPQVGLEKHLDQYDYVKDLVGVDHVALGPDFVAGPGRNDGPPPSGPVDRSGDHRMPPEAYSARPWFYVRGYEDITELPNVTRGLIERGWSNAEMWKVLGENWLRVYGQVWGT